MRVWCSWVCREEDYRPVTSPPNLAILGWWCSGYDSNENATLCALVNVDKPSDANDAIKADWPEFEEGEWRIFREHDDEFLPGDRFPLSNWMQERC